MKIEKITIEVFMDAWFNNEYDKISKEEFELVYAEYIDLSGLYQTKAFELVTYINYLKNRVYVLKTMVFAQEAYYEVFKTPFSPLIQLAKDTLGLNYEWNKNEKSFFSYLRKLENSARTKSLELRRKEYELEQLQKEKQQGNLSKVQSRHEFIKMLNWFNKSGYKIDREKTTVEELALMIRQINEESNQLALDNIKRK
jgi:hypothetical protein